MKTLAMLKMEKNFVALIEKHYPRKPYLAYDMKFLISRLKDEIAELEIELKAKNIIEAKRECADISNLTDYIFERISRGMLE